MAKDSPQNVKKGIPRITSRNKKTKRTLRKALLEKKRRLRLHKKKLSLKRKIMPKGINLIGFVRSETGLGESCRLAARAVQSANIPFGLRIIMREPWISPGLIKKRIKHCTTLILFI
jgi:ATP-dependent protease HslVU (ClpYQ) ATPase subunit